LSIKDPPLALLVTKTVIARARINFVNRATLRNPDEACIFLLHSPSKIIFIEHPPGLCNQFRSRHLRPMGTVEESQVCSENYEELTRVVIFVLPHARDSI
jgi:hypothetical protein